MIGIEIIVPTRRENRLARTIAIDRTRTLNYRALVSKQVRAAEFLEPAGSCTSSEIRPLAFPIIALFH
jgi:hypothetical protein